MSDSSAAPQLEFVERHRDRLALLSGSPAIVVLILRGSVKDRANAVADLLGDRARVHVLGDRGSAGEAAQLDHRVRYAGAETLQARLDYLLRIGRPQAIIEAGTTKRAMKLSAFRHLFFFVTPGGFYAADELDTVGDPDEEDSAGQNVIGLMTKVAEVALMSPRAAAKARAYVRQLAVHVGRIEFTDHRAVVERRGARLYAKLRDWEADEVLTARYGTSWGETIHRSPAFEFRSRTDVTNHGEGPIPPGRRTFSVPDRYLRRYDGVTCSARQIVRYEDYVVPDSWRHPHQPSLNNRQLAQTSPYFGDYLDRTRPTQTRRLNGSFYYLDTELPGHFGHITTDVLSRVWGWRRVQQIEPSTRLLVSGNRVPALIPGFQQTMFRALDLPVDDAVVIEPNEAVEVETLYGPTPQLENPHYIDPAIGEIWAELAAGLPTGRVSPADKIFVSRKPHPKRHCQQTPEIEAFFAKNGFEVIYPEDHPYPDQKMIFSRARVIAGFGGSGMFNAMFAPQARMILISGDSYNAQNEHLIAAVNGNELHYFWGQSQIPMPEKGFSLAAFTSPWKFDLRRHRRALRRLIR